MGGPAVRRSGKPASAWRTLTALTVTHTEPVLPDATDPVTLHVEHSTVLDARLIPEGLIDPNPRQPRTVFDEDDLADLTQSIRQVGLLQPVVVRAVAAGRFELVMGERRLRASRLAGLAAVPALVRDVADADLLTEALLENIQRADLNPVEEALAFRALLDETDLTQEGLAERLGRSRQSIGHALGLLRLPEPVQRKIAAGVLSKGHARCLVGVQDPTVIARLAERIVRENLTVRMVEEIISVGDLPGWEDARVARVRPARARPVSRTDAARDLERWLDTRVRVESGRQRGRIVIDFAGLDDLDRVLAVMNVPRTQTEEMPGLDVLQRLLASGA